MEIIVFSVIIAIAMQYILSDLNVINSTSYNIGLGTDETVTAITNLQNSLKTQTDTGKASFTSVAGITLTSSWNIVTTMMTVIWNFIAGNWITSILSFIQVNGPIALLIRGLWFISLGFILLKILFKVRT